VASFHADSVPPAPQLLRRLNVAIPRDVRVLAVREVEEGFSARHSARARRYRYQMLRRRSALWTRYYHVLRWPVEVAAMSEAARAFLGEQDFTAFANARAGDNGRCLVSRAEVQEDPERVWFEITANRFLHNMVRRLSGALVEVGRGRLRPSQMRDILRRRDRSRGGPCLPAAGLFFVSVDYGPSSIPPPGVDVDAAGANP
jgi:tRNA pseudouridine38-40 synthase